MSRCLLVASTTCLVAALVAAPAASAGCEDARELHRLGLDPSRSEAEREASLREAVAACPTDPCIANDLGDLLELTGRATEAEEKYRRAVTLDPTFTPAILGQAGLALARGANAEAADLYARAWDADFATARTCPAFDRPADARCLTDDCERARAALAFDKAHRVRRASKARADVREIAGGRAEDMKAGLRRGAIFFRDANLGPQAIRDLEAAAALEGDADAWLVNEIGVNLGLSEKWDDAAMRFERARDLAPGWPEPLLNLGHARHAQGRFAEAADAYRAGWSMSKVPLTDRALLEMHDAEEKAGRAGVLAANVIAGVIRTKGASLGKTVYDDSGMKVAPGSAATQQVVTAEPPRDVWKDQDMPQKTAISSPDGGRDASSGMSCNPEAPTQPHAGAASASFDVRIEFDFGKADIRADALPAIDELARGLSYAKGRIARVNLLGHTDCIGSREVNDALSRERAEAVAAALAARGVSSGMVAVDSFGFMRPRATNATAMGRAQNRRVEVKLDY